MLHANEVRFREKEIFIYNLFVISMYQFRSKNLILQTTQLKRGAIYILKIEAWSVCNLLTVAIDI